MYIHVYSFIQNSYILSIPYLLALGRTSRMKIWTNQTSSCFHIACILVEKKIEKTKTTHKKIVFQNNNDENLKNNLWNVFLMYYSFIQQYGSFISCQQLNQSVGIKWVENTESNRGKLQMFQKIETEQKTGNLRTWRDILKHKMHIKDCIKTW